MVQGAVFAERNNFHKKVYLILFALGTKLTMKNFYTKYYTDDQKLTKFEFFIFVISAELHRIDLEIA